uniref:Uncharacterized protein n=1 Tax=Rhizophora mucronata TaxID=61149 RepID=A0A2P2Q1E1_RHIMU
MPIVEVGSTRSLHKWTLSNIRNTISFFLEDRITLHPYPCESM